MKKHLFVLSAISAFALSANVSAETSATAATAAAPAAATTTAEAAKPSAGKIMGSVDLRPSWTTLSGETHMENSVLAGYQFNDKVSTYGVFNFNTNIHTPGEELGLNPQPIDLSVRTKVAKIYTEPNTGIVLSYENRVYAPITQSSRDKGMVTAIRNYIVATKALGESVKLSLYEVPIVHLYQAAGSVSASGAASANPIFENRIYLLASIDITKKLNLTLPLYFHMTKYRDFQAGAAKNDITDFFLYTYPELGYAINDNVTVGAAYYSDNLVLGDLSKTSLSAGLEQGVFQVFVAANL